MRFLILTHLPFAICLGCNYPTNSNKTNYCFILRDFDNTNYVFLLENKNTCYDQNFVRKLPAGFTVPNSQITLEDRDLATFIKMPNTKRNPLIYGGDLDKYYTGYFTKVIAFSYKIEDSTINSIKLNISNKEV